MDSLGQLEGKGGREKEKTEGEGGRDKEKKRGREGEGGRERERETIFLTCESEI